MHVEPLLPTHADEVLRIYQAGIDAGDATFETDAPSWDYLDASKLADHRFVALDDDRVIGWIMASPTSSRPVYAGVVEHSVYVDPAAQGRGVGRLLLERFIASTESAGIWTIRAGIFGENEASLRLHAAVGFRTVGVHERLGQALSGPYAGEWRDVVLMERRSSVV